MNPAVERPMSDAEVRAACPGIRTYLYRELARMRRLPPRPFALLYETSPGYGHWVAVLDTPEGVTHFDSYGLRPDAELAWVPPRYRRAFGAGSPQMVRLLLGVRGPVNYSEFTLQSEDPRVATCGRWAALRCRNRHLTDSQFADAVEGQAERFGLTLDELAAALVPLEGE